MLVLIPKIVQIIALIMIIFYTHTERRRAPVIGVNRFPKWEIISPLSATPRDNDCNFQRKKETRENLHEVFWNVEELRSNKRSISRKKIDRKGKLPINVLMFND